MCNHHNHSLAKESAYNSSAKSCERDKVTLTEYDDEKVKLEANIDELEDERSAIASKLATIDSLPELANDRASIEEKNHQVCLLQEEIEGVKRIYLKRRRTCQGRMIRRSKTSKKRSVVNLMNSSRNANTC